MSKRYKLMKQFVRYHFVLGEYEDAYFLLANYKSSNEAEEKSVRTMIDTVSRECYLRTGKVLN